MAGNFPLLNAYISLSTRGFERVRGQLLRLKAITAQLSNTTVVDLDVEKAVSSARRVKRAVKDATKKGDGKPVDLLGNLTQKSATTASDAVRQLRVDLREAGVAGNLKNVLKVDSTILAFQRSVAALKQQIALQKKLGNTEGAKALVAQIYQRIDAFKKLSAEILKNAAVRQRGIDAEKRAEKSIIKARLATGKTAEEISADKAVAAFRRKIRSAERVRRFYELVDKDRQRAAEQEARRVKQLADEQERQAARAAAAQAKAISAARGSLAGLGGGSFGSLTNGLRTLTTTAQKLAALPATATGFLGSLGKYARSAGGLIAVLDGALPVLDLFGAALAGVGSFISGFAGLVSFGVGVIKSFVSTIGSLLGFLGQVAGAAASATLGLAGFVYRAIRPAITAVLDFVFPLRGLVSLLGDIKRRIGPFLASFLAFKGLSTIAQEVAEFEQNLIRAAAQTANIGEDLTVVFGALSRAASDVAAKTRFSTSEVSASILELTKAGLDAASAIQVLQPTLNLATLANVDATTATNIFTRALAGFALTTGESVNVLNALVSATRQSPIELEETGRALVNASASSRLLGLSIEDTLAALVKFGEVGIRGEVASTALQRAFERLVSPTLEVQEALQQVLAPQGKTIFDFLDQQGSLKEGRKSFLELIDTFSTAIKRGDLTATLRGEIFGAKNRAIINLFTDSIDQRTGLMITARQKLEQVMRNIATDQAGNISQNAINFESAGFPALAERVSGMFSRIGETLKTFFGSEIRTVLIEFIRDFEFLNLALEDFGSVRRIFEGIKQRFTETKTALAPLLGFIIRMNTVIATGLLLTISEIAKRFSGPFLAGLRATVGYVSRFFGFDGTQLLSSWQGTFLLLEALIKNFSTVFSIAIEKVKQYASVGAFSLLNGFYTAFNAIIASSGSFAANFLNAISSVIAGTISVVSKAIAIMVPPLVNGGTLLGLAVAKGLVQGMTSALGSLLGPQFKAIVNQFIPGLGDLLNPSRVNATFDALISAASTATQSSLSVAGQQVGSELQGLFNGLDLSASLNLNGFANNMNSVMEYAGFQLYNSAIQSFRNSQELRSLLSGVDPRGVQLSPAGLNNASQINRESAGLMNAARAIQNGLQSQDSANYLRRMYEQQRSQHGQQVRLQQSLINAVEELDGGLQ